MRISDWSSDVCSSDLAGWEVASHGLKWIDYKDFTREEERRHMQEAIRIHRDATGERPLGWYTGRNSVHTLDLVTEEGGFVYSADSYADDLPYWIAGPNGPHLIEIGRASGRDRVCQYV